MANKLAGQRAKYTKALAEYNKTEDDVGKEGPLRKMLEVLLEAPHNGFAEAEVASGQEIPSEVQRLMEEGVPVPTSPPEDPDQLVRQIERMVDTSDLHEEGNGDQFVYA